MTTRYSLARSLCEVVAWDPEPLSASLRGEAIYEVDERCCELGVVDDEKHDVLGLARDIATAVTEREWSTFRILSSKPKLVPETARIWAIGQEWLELIRRATKRIIIVSPALDEIAAESLRLALSAAFRAGTLLTVLHGALGKLERRQSALRILTDAFPNVEVLEWPTEFGFLHAKVISVDNTTIYLGSANVTEYGWDRNVEVGISIKGPAAVPLVQYCEGLVALTREQRQGREQQTPRLRDDRSPRTTG